MKIAIVTPSPETQNVLMTFNIDPEGNQEGFSP
jgi:hypothetical protein